MLYTFYGDDFTGSTDVLEQLALNGVPAVLFLCTPSEDQLEQFRGMEAIGIAGDSRSRSPEWMNQNLPSIFDFLKSLKAKINHYKICSTFDSSPERGSIGRAIDIGRKIFNSRFVPVLAAAPHLKRFVIFGNLFARDSDGIVKRIDRHSMAQHPATPMQEADLCRHLAIQTATEIELLELPSIQSHSSEALSLLLERGAKVVLFDGFDDADLKRSGELLMNYAERSQLFVVGSSGVTSAILSTLARGKIDRARTKTAVEDRQSQPLLVVSGSCSLVTMSQIRYAIDHGFRGIAVDASRLCSQENSKDLVENICRDASESLADGVSTVIYTALGPQNGSPVGNELGARLGELLRMIVQNSGQHRVILCGGDTSSQAVQQLGCYALTWLQATQPGAPLCRVHSQDASLGELELVLKGGQVGSPDFFEVVRDL
jgi:uncharacterized protein YgbK (DUF1537 family)